MQELKVSKILSTPSLTTAPVDLADWQPELRNGLIQRRLGELGWKRYTHVDTGVATVRFVGVSNGRDSIARVWPC